MNLAIFLQCVEAHFESPGTGGFQQAFKKLDSRRFDLKHHILVQRIYFPKIRLKRRLAARLVPLLELIGMVKCSDGCAPTRHSNENRFLGRVALVRDEPNLSLPLAKLQEPGLGGSDLLFQAFHLASDLRFLMGGGISFLGCALDCGLEISQAKGRILHLKGGCAFCHLFGDGGLPLLLFR